MPNITITGGGAWTAFPVPGTTGTITITNASAGPIYAVAFDSSTLTTAAHWMSWAKIQPGATSPFSLPNGWVTVKAQMLTTTLTTFTAV
jgi:hypothetical protein